jgi:aryl-alcohol dehydrogenase
MWIDEPRPHEVLVRITAVGMCHTDLSVRAGHTPFPLPAVLGHEGAGVVERVGHAVTGVTAGDRVVISFDSCGTCRPCEAGRPVQCRHWPALNLLGGSRLDGSPAVTSAGAHADQPLHGCFFGHPRSRRLLWRANATSSRFLRQRHWNCSGRWVAGCRPEPVPC